MPSHHAVIPFLDLTAVYESARSDIDAALLRVAGSGMYLLGSELAAFEAAYARRSGAGHCVGVANGLDALHLALLALGVGEGDEVIVPSNTYIATWLAVSRCRATVVPVEPVEATYNIDPARVAEAISPRTKVILPVHLYGQPADMEAINALAREHGVRVLDDCAQAHAARYKGRPVGSLAAISAWSFYPGKNLGAFGDAGAVTSDDRALVEQVRVLGNYGSRVKYHNEVKGFNSRLDELQAAVLAAKLAGLDDATERRRAVAARYLDGMRGLPLRLPAVAASCEPSWHLFVVRHRDRDAFQKRLAERGVGTLIHYPIPPHLQPAYAELGWSRGRFPLSEAIHAEVLSLPMWPGLDDAAVEQVIDAVRACA
jgi:dTDP-4-amino-4,6-dideoxygalactose transaminase